mmetsp:Transcript_46685/g.109801  ORF Transcript_46685/g.109801 Transcript_46685/m.109801 type:complete len:347 (-) Transcript_46685:488-1528(-)
MLISALSASISLACSLTRFTSCSRSAFIASLDGPTSATMRVCVELSSFSSRCCCAVNSATLSSLSVLEMVTRASSALASSMRCFHTSSSCCACASCFFSCARSSCAVLFTAICSRVSRSISCPNLSSCTSLALASNSCSLTSLAFFDFISCTCSRRSCFCCFRSSTFSFCNSCIRSCSCASPLFVNTMVWLRLAGRRLSTRHCIWCILRQMTTSISLRRCCLKVWNCWISVSHCRRAVSITFSFFTSASLSFFSASTDFWNSFNISSWSRRFSLSSHTLSYKAGSHPTGQNSSSSSSSSSSSRSSQLSSSSLASASLPSSSSSSASALAFFLIRLIFFLKILSRSS